MLRGPKSLISCGFAESCDEGIHLYRNAPAEISPLFLDKLPIFQKTKRQSRVEEKKGFLEYTASEDAQFVVDIMLNIPAAL